MIIYIQYIMIVLGIIMTLIGLIINIKRYAIIILTTGMFFIIVSALTTPTSMISNITYFDVALSWMLIGFILVQTLLFFYKLFQQVEAEL